MAAVNAMTACQATSGAVAMFPSQADQDAVVTGLSIEAVAPVWIGLTCTSAATQCQNSSNWVDALSGGPVAYLDWAAGFPKKVKCAVLATGASAGTMDWESRACTDLAAALCKR